MLAALLQINFFPEGKIMNSKMTLVALVVAGAFATPAMAASDKNTVTFFDKTTGTATYIDVGDAKLEEAIAQAQKQHDKKPTLNPLVWGIFNLYGNDNGKDNYGTATLSLTADKTYTVDALQFNSGSGLKKAEHYATLNLSKTSLIANHGIRFSNASSGEYDQNKLLPVEALKSINTVNLTDNSSLTGDVINTYDSPSIINTSAGKYYFNNGLSNTTTVNLSKNAKWTGDLRDIIDDDVDEGSTVIKPDAVHGVYTVNLTEGSAWVGGVSVAEKSSVDVTLDGTSSWTVAGDSTVNSINAPAAAEAAARTPFRAAPAKTGVFLEDNVTLTLAKGDGSVINELHSGVGSTLAVENTNVKVVKAVGGTHIVLDEKADVTVDAAEKLNATFNSVAEGTKLTSAKDVKANIEVAGELADEMGIDKVIEAFKANNVFTGSGDVVFKGGYVADDIIGSMVNDKFVVEGHRVNEYLLSIGDSTAVTMMQWRADADDMAQRMGELRNNEGTVGLWARTFGGKAEKSHISNEYNGLQFGADTLIGDNATKHFVGGAFSYSKGDADFGNGTGDNYMLSMTGYSTWLFESGSYVDVSGKFGKLNNEFDIGHGEAALKGKYNTYGVAMAVETGHRFPLSNLAYIEPQLAFTAAHIMSEDYNANHGIKVEQDSINSYVARVGIQTGLNCPDNMGSVFVRASYLYDFDGETSTKVKSSIDSNKFDQDFGGGWYELGVGMNVNFTKNFHGFADFEYASGGEIKTPYRWNAGVRYTF